MYIAPDLKSPVIAYVAPGEEVKVNVKNTGSGWNEMLLESGGVGRIQARHVKPASEEKEKNKNEWQNGLTQN